jgi:glyoxylase-like metal-dependent hydrolase (beta-lactamase superfamily II)
MLDLQILPVGEYGTNCYVLSCPKTGRGLLVDPGGDPDRVLEACSGLHIGRIALTHGHADHVMGLGPVREALGARVGIHPADAAAFDLQADFDLYAGMILRVGHSRVKVYHVPGHTPGSIALRFGDRALVGDAVFPGGPGHSRSPEALETLLNSLQATVFTWPDSTTLFSGHGDSTTVGATRPLFQAFLARPRPADLSGDVTWESK